MSEIRDFRWLAGPASMVVMMALSGSCHACHAASGGPASAGGAQGEPALPASLEGREWVLRELGQGDAAPARPEVTLRVAEGRVEGVAACNQYGASFETDGTSLTLGPMRLTRKACPPPTMDLERRYVAALQAARSWRLDDESLHIEYADGQDRDTLVFVPREPPARRQTSEARAVDLGSLPADREQTGLREAPAPGVPDPLVPLVRDVKADLAARLGIDVAEIELVSAEAVDWPDAGLGCPEPGMIYAQVITPGYRLVLTAEDVEHRYHTRGTGEFRACE